MKSIVMSRFGGAEELVAANAPDPPVARDGWVVVKVAAAALNWHDILVRRGQYRSPLPHTPGADGAGVRTDTGEEVVILPSLFWGGERTAAPGGPTSRSSATPRRYLRRVRQRSRGVSGVQTRRLLLGAGGRARSGRGGHRLPCPVHPRGTRGGGGVVTHHRSRRRCVDDGAGTVERRGRHHLRDRIVAGKARTRTGRRRRGGVSCTPTTTGRSEPGRHPPRAVRGST